MQSSGNHAVVSTSENLHNIIDTALKHGLAEHRSALLQGIPARVRSELQADKGRPADQLRSDVFSLFGGGLEEYSNLWLSNAYRISPAAPFADALKARNLPVPDPAGAAGTILATFHRYLKPIQRQWIGGEHIPRDETKRLIDHIEKVDKPATIVTGPAGTGKSGVVAQAAAHFHDRGWPIVAMRFDRLQPCPSTGSLGEQLELDQSPVHALVSVASGRRCLVVVDQVDAVSEISGRHPQFFERISDLLDEARTYPSIRILMACRDFDLDHDWRLRALLDQNTGIASRIRVGRLAPEAVRALANSLRPNTRLSTAQVALLSLPIYLWLWSRSPRLDAGFSTAFELLNAYREEISRKLRAKHRRSASECWTLISEVLDYMSERQVLSAPMLKFADKYGHPIDILCSEGVLVKDANGRLAFAHEALYDHFFARRWVRNGRPLMDHLRGGEQHLSMRTTIRQVLEHLRFEPDERAVYLRTLRGLVLGDGIRFHVRQMVRHWLGQLIDPTLEEWQLVQEARDTEDDERQRWQWRRITLSSAWFDLLHKHGHIVALLSSDQTELIDEGVRRLHWAARERATNVLECVEAWEGRGPEWTKRLFEVMRGAWFGSDERWPRLFVRSLAHQPDAFHDNADQFIRFFENYLKCPESAVAVAGALLTDQLHRWWTQFDQLDVRGWRATPSLELDSLGHEWRWKSLADAAPAAFCSEVLPQVLEAIRLASNKTMKARQPLSRYLGLEDGLISNSLWLGPGVDLMSSDRWHVVEALEHAFRTLKPEALDDAIALIDQYSRYETAAHLLLRAYIAGGERWADRCVERLIGQPALLEMGYTSSAYWVSREAIVVASAQCSSAEYDRLEATLLDLYPHFETKYRRTQLRTWLDSRRCLTWSPHLLAMGRAQFALLGGLPAARRSVRVRRRLAELRRRFDRSDVVAPHRGEVGFVGPPFDARWHAMSDDDWRRAMIRYDSDDRAERAHFLRGGASQLASKLEEQVKLQPARFAALAEGLSASVEPVYLSAVLRGITNADDGAPAIEPDQVWRLIRSLPVASARWIPGILRKYAPTGVPDDIVDLLAWHAIENPDPHPGDRSFTTGGGGYLIDTHGLNSVRGAMCHAIRDVILADKAHIERLDSAIDSLVSDSSAAVRSQVPEMLLALLQSEPTKAAQLYIRLHDRADDPWLGIYDSRFIEYADHQVMNAICPVLWRATASNSPDTRKTAAMFLTLSVFREQLQPYVLTRLWATADHSIRTSIVEIAGRVFAHPDHRLRRLAMTYLSRAFDDGGKVSEGATRCFWQLIRTDDDVDRSALVSSPEVRVLIERFLDSPAFGASRNRMSLMRFFRESKTRIPDVMLRVFERLASVNSTGYSRDTELLYRLYEDTDCPAVRLRCLDIIDILLRRGDHNVTNILRDLEL